MSLGDWTCALPSWLQYHRKQQKIRLLFKTPPHQPEGPAPVPERSDNSLQSAANQIPPRRASNENPAQGQYLMFPSKSKCRERNRQVSQQYPRKHDPSEREARNEDADIAPCYSQDVKAGQQKRETSHTWIVHPMLLVTQSARAGSFELATPATVPVGRDSVG